MMITWCVVCYIGMIARDHLFQRGCQTESPPAPWPCMISCCNTPDWNDQDLDQAPAKLADDPDHLDRGVLRQGEMEKGAESRQLII